MIRVKDIGGFNAEGDTLGLDRTVADGFVVQHQAGNRRERRAGVAQAKWPGDPKKRRRLLEEARKQKRRGTWRNPTK